MLVNEPMQDHRGAKMTLERYTKVKQGSRGRWRWIHYLDGGITVCDIRGFVDNYEAVQDLSNVLFDPGQIWVERYYGGPYEMYYHAAEYVERN